MQRLLVVDDEPNLRYSMTKALQSDSLQVITAETGAQAISMVHAERPHAIILDVRLPDAHGLDVFNEIRGIDPAIPVIIVTAFSTMDTAVEAMKRGAYEYLVKPIELDCLREHVQRALEISRANQAFDSFDPVEEHRAEQLIVGKSPAIQEVFKAIGRIAPQDITVLIQGESGTGKELIAEAIWKHSLRAGNAFLTINCAAIPETILESELFGHERGAFTGAHRTRIGKFEQVDGGTLFLDEIGDMSSMTQAKVLRLLQDGSFQRVGGNHTHRGNVRIIAATNRDLEEMVAQGKFREDLYYRLCGFVIDVPPLRERIEDLEPLVQHFVMTFGRELGRQIRVITPEAMHCMEMYRWPGNVRELQIVVRHALLHAVGETVTSGSLPSTLRGGAKSGDASSHDSRDDVLASLVDDVLVGNNQNVYRKVHSALDRVLLQKVLDHVDGNQVQAAEILGISRTTLRNRLRELELVED
ncbi:MAG: sigma-54-dependent Fis family transcriptional regulator [Pseudomonadales bacterium]|nr:sigma-54-dependent Fis family transcriptional regulator [Pseudomonadales bacterium]